MKLGKIISISFCLLSGYSMQAYKITYLKGSEPLPLSVFMTKSNVSSLFTQNIKATHKDLLPGASESWNQDEIRKSKKIGSETIKFWIVPSKMRSYSGYLLAEVVPLGANLEIFVTKDESPAAKYAQKTNYYAPYQITVRDKSTGKIYKNH